MMRKLEGEFAQWYNLRRKRSGAFWEDRYHCTMVDRGTYAWNCMKYIDLNMVRAGVVGHPAQWAWCSYDELIGNRTRYRLLEMTAVLRSQDMSRESFIRQYSDSIGHSIQLLELKRDPIWTQSIAVGSEQFTEVVTHNVQGRTRLEREELTTGCWVVSESSHPYGAF